MKAVILGCLLCCITSSDSDATVRRRRHAQSDLVPAVAAGRMRAKRSGDAEGNFRSTELLKRMGGVDTATKNRLLSYDRVYISQALRSKYLDEQAYNRLAVCQGSVSGPGPNNAFIYKYAYFACPMHPTGASSPSRNKPFCCKDASSRQFCCSRMEFYRRNGLKFDGQDVSYSDGHLIAKDQQQGSNLAVRMAVLAASLVSTLLFAACIGCIICMCISSGRSRSQQRPRQMAQPYAGSAYGGGCSAASLSGSAAGSSTAGSGATRLAAARLMPKSQMPPSPPPPPASSMSGPPPPPPPGFVMSGPAPSPPPAYYPRSADNDKMRN